MTHHKRPDKKDWRNFYILMAFLLAVVPWLLVFGSGKPQVKYVDVPVQSEPQACPVAPEPANPVCEPKEDSVWPEPSDMPTPWKIIPKPRPLPDKIRKLRKFSKAKRPLEYIDANGTRFYPMRNWPY